MAFKSLESFIALLEKENELIRIKSFVNPELEITEITDRISKQPGGGKALYFENTGTNFPVITNMMGSEKRICLALETNALDDFGTQIHNLFVKITSERTGLIAKMGVLPVLSQIASWLPEVTSKKSPCQEIILKSADLAILPILKCWPFDGGKFITLPMVHTKDPINGNRNIGMYRMQVIDSNTTAMHWQIHKTGARHYEQYKKMGMRMPVAVAIGGDPVYTYASTAPLPEGIDEYMLAGFLRKSKVKLVKCITQDMEVPADADFIIEGYVDPEEELFWEGPFGDHTGFYSLEDWYPKFHITCITHRSNPVYPATIVGIPPQEDAYIAKATERIFIQPIKKTMIPEMVDMDLPIAGVAHNLAIISIDQKYPAQAIKVFSSLWGAGQMMLNKVMVVVDKDIDVHDYNVVFKNIIQNTRIPEDILISRGPSDALDHASHLFASGGKLGIDATFKGIHTKVAQNISDADCNLIETDILRILDEAVLECVFPLPDYAVLIIQLRPDYSKNIRSYAKKISDLGFPLKAILWLDVDIDLTDIYSIMWFSLGGIDPVRDCWFVDIKTSGNTFINIDATIKTAEKDSFHRPWPNPVLMSEDIMDKVNKNWKEYFNIPFIESPTFKYRNIQKNSGPITYANITD
jgi:4-hydroxy-3-polyprenylbenzoate decarboxylase